MAEIHVVLARTAVEHQRAEQHFDQQRIGDRGRTNFAGRSGGRRRFELIVVEEFAEQSPKVVALARESSVDFGREQCGIVAEPQADAGKGDRRADLLGQSKSSHGQPQLPQQARQRALLRARGAKFVSACRPTS